MNALIAFLVRLLLVLGLASSPEEALDRLGVSWQPAGPAGLSVVDPGKPAGGPGGSPVDEGDDDAGIFNGI